MCSQVVQVFVAIDLLLFASVDGLMYCHFECDRGWIISDASVCMGFDIRRKQFPWILYIIDNKSLQPRCVSFFVKILDLGSKKRCIPM